VTARKVLLLRHGRTSWNAQRRFQGQADPPLDEVGRAQAYEVAELIAALRPGLLITSDAVRAMQTAEIVGEVSGRSLIADARLRERNLGHWEGLTRDDVEQRYPEEYADWVAGRDVSRRGGETREQVAERALAAFAELPDLPTLVIVTHSATAMALTNALLGIPQAVHPLGPLANCHWSELYAEAHEGSNSDGSNGDGSNGDGRVAWRLRGHNLGTPGAVVPLPVRPEMASEDVTDADA
jgi:glucosyl-3-phosphoglycerate phosphatase